MGNYDKFIPKASEKYGTRFLSGNYCDVARGLGAYSERIEQPNEIVPALERAIEKTRSGEPALLEFITREEPDMATPAGSTWSE
jgi:acetolactate synthase-1/2/3 large subunit